MGTWKNRKQDPDQRMVNTPYGKGLVIRTHKGEESIDQYKVNTTCDIIAAINATSKLKTDTNTSTSVSKGPQPQHQQRIKQDVQLLEWDMSTHPSTFKSRGQRKESYPTLFSTSHLPSVEPQIGDEVLCQYGRGKLANIVPDPNNKDQSRLTAKYEVHLTSWRLARRSIVKCILRRQDVHVVRKKTMAEMDVYERVEFAKGRKKAAAVLFQKKEFDRALEEYASAVNAVRFVQHESNSDNEVRADLIEVMITCSNNAGTCCVKKGQWPEAGKFGKNALILIDALYEKQGFNIHKILKSSGIGDIKLFAEWKVKSLLLIARAEAEAKEYSAAITHLRKAREALNAYYKPTEAKNANLASQDKEVKRLMTVCMQHLKAEKKKEKLRAQAMFGGGSKTSKKNLGGAKTSTKNLVEAKTSMKNLTNPVAAAESSSTVQEKTSFDGQDEKKDLLNDVKDKEEIDVKVVRKTVSFSPDVTKGIVEEDDEEEEEGWFDEHKEALIMAGVGGLLACSFLFLRGASRKS